MIDFFSENNFKLSEPEQVKNWIGEIIVGEGKQEGEISFVFCSDEYLLDLNRRFLDHDTLTDILSFDNSIGNEIHGEIYISTERVKENAADFDCKFNEEILRVMAHGILHFCGYNDKTDSEKQLMRAKEDRALSLVKH
ncbi:MAG: rRNA maturation RNase YbeY [Bacteroidia bacterium]|nr:rRNA maturation RNase YbeY [Bacteroidia bacterium]